MKIQNGENSHSNAQNTGKIKKILVNVISKDSRGRIIRGIYITIAKKPQFYGTFVIRGMGCVGHFLISVLFLSYSNSNENFFVTVKRNVLRKRSVG